VSLGSQALHLLLQSQLLTLQLPETITVRGRAGHFVLDRPFQGLMPRSEFAKVSVDGHDRKAPVLIDSEK